MILRGMKTLPWGRKGAVTGQFSLYHAQQQIRYFQHLICNMCLTYLGFFLLCTVFLYCMFVKFCLTAINEWSSQTHCHYPCLHMITWWSRMNAFFSAENLNCIFMQIPWKRMLFYGQTQKMQLSCHVVQTKSYKPCDCKLHAQFWFCTQRLFEPIW